MVVGSPGFIDRERFLNEAWSKKRNQEKRQLRQSGSGERVSGDAEVNTDSNNNDVDAAGLCKEEEKDVAKVEESWNDEDSAVRTPVGGDRWTILRQEAASGEGGGWQHHQQVQQQQSSSALLAGGSHQVAL